LIAQLKCRLLLQEIHQSSDNNEIDLQIIRIKLRISKLQDNKIKPLKKRIRQLIEKIRLAEQQVDNMHKDKQYLESIKSQNNSITNKESLAQD
jgi:gamma-glutamylcysteine synthetase